MNLLRGQKIGMTQVFAPDGATVSVTLIRIPETRVIAHKTADRDGYVAVQVGTQLLDEKKAAKVLSRSERGHLKASAIQARHLYEIRMPLDATLDDYKVGSELKLDTFTPGDAVQVRGTSKGRGFAGVVKRHHFAGGPASHGHKDNLRAPGSIGSGHPQHVQPGTRMAGHMGDATVSLKNLEVISINAAERLLVLKGSVPGAVNAWVTLKHLGRKVSHPVSARKAIVAASAEKEVKKEEKKK